MKLTGLAKCSKIRYSYDIMHESWQEFLKAEFEKPYFQELSSFLHQEYENKVIFPPKKLVFSAFTTDLNEVKVVILGQDPYHTPGAAEGLAFSVPSSQPIPAWREKRRQCISAS